MPNYDFRCNRCGKIVERNMPFVEAEKGFACECSGTMERQFSPCGNLKCSWNIPYCPGCNAKEDRKRAFNSQVEKGKLPDNFADLK